MKKQFLIPALLIAVMGVAFAYISIAVSPSQIEILPGESSIVTATVTSNENYDMSIDCEINEFSEDGTFLGTVINDAEGCEESPADIKVTFANGGILLESLSNDTSEELTVTLDSSVEEGRTYKYKVRAGDEYSEASVTADVNVIPEFSTLAALTALLGTGVVFIFLRRKHN